VSESELVIDVPGLGLRTFGSRGEFRDFLDRETSAWTELKLRAEAATPAVSGVALQPLRAHADRWGFWRGHVDPIDEAETTESQKVQAYSEKCRQLSQALQTSTLVSRTSPLGGSILELAQRDIGKSAFALSLSVGGFSLSDHPVWMKQIPVLMLELGSPRGTEALERASLAAADAEQASSRAKVVVGMLEGELARQTGGWIERTDKWDEQAAQERTDSANASADQLKDMRSEFDSLKAAYDAQMKLRAPRDYWHTNGVSHARAAAIWGAAFVLVVILGGYMVKDVIDIHSSGITAARAGSYGWVPSALFIGASGFLLLWVLRICARQFGEHILRRQDARERVVMVDTFLALTKESLSPAVLATEPQLAIVLSALFRSGPGLGSDDSPPATLFEAVSRLAPSAHRK